MIADIVLATLGCAGLPERIPIKSVHRAFWELSKEREYAPLLASLSFVEGPDVPVSEELETALFRLCSSGLCSVDNPDFRHIRISEESRTAMIDVIRRHVGPEKLGELERLAAQFRKLVQSSMK